MSLDLQIQNLTLLSLVQGDLQQALNTTCIPPFLPFYVDHADVVGVTMSVGQQVTQFQVPVNVFIVDQTSLQANMNGTPPGAITPVAQATLLLQLTVQGAQLSLACTSVTVPDPQFLSAAQQIQQSIGTVGSVDLSPMFSQLGLPAPSSSSMQQVGSSLMIRFDPTSVAVDHLQSGENWCAFVDAATMRALAQSKLNGPLSQLSGHGITGVSVSATWAPSGTTPHVNIKITGAAQVPDPFSGNVEVDLGVDFLLQGVIPKNSSQSPDDLEELVNWNLSIDLGDFVPQFIDDYVAAQIAAQFDPTKFGGTVVGPREFSLEQNLPPLSFGGATLAYTSLIGLSDGMVLGGPVNGILSPSTNIVTFNVLQFPDLYSTFADCLGGGHPTPPTLGTVSISADAPYSGAGKLCSVDILSPTGGFVDVSPYLVVSPAPGSVTDTGNISFTLSGTVALLVANNGQPIQVLVRTTRGVRIINFGLPPAPQIDDSGHVTNQHVIVINDCPGNPVPWSQIFQIFNPLWSPDPPENWTDNLEQVAAFESSLITVGVQPGEVVTFNQPIDGGLSVFTAGGNGQVVVPALLAVRSFSEEAVLSTASRSSLRTVQVNATLFRQVAVLDTPGARSHLLNGDSERAVIVSTFLDRIETTEIDVLGIPRSVGKIVGGGTADVGLKVAASARADIAQKARHPNLDIPGLVRILPVPGYEGSSIAVAELDDGSYRTLAKEKDGATRVTGILARWPNMPPVSGAWAISSSTGDRVAIFAVSQVTRATCCCHCSTQAMSDSSTPPK
jgi:hypothetical protein